MKFSIDKSKSSVAFSVTHMVVSEAEGVFKVFNGSMESSQVDYSDAAIEFSVDVKSLNTDNQNRDKHLKGPEFFDVAKFPLMKFASTSFVHQNGSNYKLSGNLTIKAITKPVSFAVTYAGLSSDQKTAVFNAKTTIDRFDYGLQWSKLTEAGGMIVSREIRVNVTAAFKVK
ncbi:MAG: YceI family protein [Chitinophagaceae bacterium]